MEQGTPIERLARNVVAGETRAVARAIRLVDDRSSNHRELLKLLATQRRGAWVVGVTGNPGAGKSTLVDQLVKVYRDRDKRVAVLAVDPTSPFSGGAILGDRIRMQRHFLDEGVFIRSLATRGQIGGLSRSTVDALVVLDAAGFDILIVETVGVGQDELDVAKLAHTTCLVAAPGLGDEVQAIKAGILEVADILVVNKADRPGADGTVRNLEMMIALGREAASAGADVMGHGVSHSMLALDETGQHGDPGGNPDRKGKGQGEAPSDSSWTPPVLRTNAVRGEGLEALAEAIEAHRGHVDDSDEQKLERARQRIYAIVRDVLWNRVEPQLRREVESRVREVLEETADPYSAADEIVEQVLAPIADKLIPDPGACS